MTDLAIVIISWNVRPLLANCLLTVQADIARSRLSAQIWVVDNDSSDGSVAMLRQHFPEVHLIASRRNLGFAGGNNAALQAIGFDSPQPHMRQFKGTGLRVGSHSTPSQPPPARGRSQLPPQRGGLRGGEWSVIRPNSNKLAQVDAYAPQPSPDVSLPEAVLLLNPDTLVHPGALSALHRFLKETPQAGIAGARLLYANGTFQHGAFGFPGLWQLAIELLPLPGRLVESRLNGRYPRSLYESNRPFRIDHPLGAAMCVRREAIQQVGLLDDQYHMYVEEIDWSRRIRAAGWQAYCVPQAQVTHYGGQSTGQLQSRSFINLWQSRYRYYQKYYHPLKLWLARQIVQLGLQRRATDDYRAGHFSAPELRERVSSYQQVIHIWQGKSENPHE